MRIRISLPHNIVITMEADAFDIDSLGNLIVGNWDKPKGIFPCGYWLHVRELEADEK